MNTLKQGLGFCLLMLFLLMPTGSLAEDPAPTVQKREEMVGRVTLESKEYPLDHYRMEADIGDGIKEAGDHALHSINQGMWGFNKTIASFTLYSVNQLMSFDLISTIVNEAGIMSDRIYEIMSGTFLSLFVVIAGGIAAWRYFVNQQMGYAVKAIIGALAIMTLMFWFYSNATGNIKWLNDRGAELEGIASSANVLVSSDGFDSNAAYDSKEGIAVLENQLFNLMVKRPYLLLNYGSTKETEVVSEDPNRVDKLLEIRPYNEEGKENRKIIVDDEASNFGNKQMTPDFSGERFGYLIVTIISTIALSIPILILGIFKFLLQVWFLALVIFTAIPLVLSLIPSYSETALNHGKKLVGVLLMKAGLVLLIAVITGLVTLLYESIKITSGVEGYAFVVFLICITIWGLFKYRSEIFEVASAGMIQGQQVAERMAYATTSSIGEAGEKGYQGVKRMTKGSYLAGGITRGILNRQSAENDTSFAAPSKDVIGQSQVSGSKSAKRGPSRQEELSKSTAEIAKGGSAAGFAAATNASRRSASRNAGSAIVNLADYKKEKDEGPANNAFSGPKTGNTNRKISEARNHSSEGHKETAKSNGHQTARSTSGDRKTSSHRKPSSRMEGPKGAAATRESGKHLTQWEAQQQINARKADSSSETTKRSVSMKPKAEESDQER
ncbi:hypothetical protein J7I93_09205 [Bacillus sp. ISL-47]|uniref:CD3337/EF1877 family mobilome membrane protein n=1 Tax=Bacillus sp. ISL-47 TaxID=2819130 RepID=UPI001BEBCD66|nr:hypothetical protein [Bacillus sp. ISL-47]MBT2688358.1 hypothetical protein [Bacillus sp. ISL-47]MBT2710531.1 hypothetical protein [Pseudomonas sp. ISL-84]